MREIKLNEDEQELLECFLETLTPDEIQDVAKKRGFDAAMSARFWQYIGHTDTPPGQIIIEADLDELEEAFRDGRLGAEAPGQ
jgi:hypothetical protein